MSFKKFLSFILVFALIVSTLPIISLPSKAETSGYYTYNTSTNGTAYIVDVDSSISGTVTIPSSFGNYRVVGISNSAFASCRNITHLIIPEGITYVSDSAFKNCTGLVNITIPKSLKSFGTLAFSGCTKLDNVYISDIASWCSATFSRYDEYPTCHPMYFAENLYVNGTLLSKLTIPSGVTNIGVGFSDSECITEIIIPNTVESIASGAFRLCTSLESLTLPFVGASKNANGQSAVLGYLFGSQGIDDKTYTCGSYEIPYSLKNIVLNCEKVPASAFSSMRLETVTLSDEVTYIGSGAFSNCSNLKSVYIDDMSSWFNIEFVSSQSNPLYYAQSLYVAGVETTDIEIPDGVTAIKSYSFAGVKWLNSINIPEGVTSIDACAFYNCYNLVSVNISESVKSIGNSAFYSCSKLKYANMSEGVETIGAYAFFQCASLENIAIPSSVTSIGSLAFSGCSSLNKVSIKNIQSWCNISFADYGANPLYYAENLYINNELITDLVIPDTVTEIKNNAFYNWKNLSSIHIGEKLETISNTAFIGCEKLVNISVSENNSFFTSINGVLYNNECTILRLYPAGIANVFELPVGVETIYSNAFYNCENLTKISIPKSLKEIQSSAFYGCKNLTDVRYEGTVADKENMQISTSGNSYLLSATWHYNSCVNHSYSGNCDDTCDNCDWTRTVTESHVFQWVLDKAETCVEDGYKHEECVGCNLIRNENTVILATGEHNYINSWDTICSICGAERVVSGVTGDCTWTLNGTTLVISGFGRMKDYYLAEKTPWGTNITKIVINKGVTSIGNRTFCNMNSLTEVEIADSVENIGEAAFYDCTSLKNITIPDSVKTMGDWVFECCSALEMVILPKGLTHIGYASFDECTALRTVVIPDSVTSIDHWAFNNCSSLTNVVMPQKLTSMGNGCFSGCTSLKKITIPAAITKIPAETFVACTSLTEVIIQNKITEVCEAAFLSCKSLKDIWYVGSASDKNNIAIGNYNDKLLSANWHYNGCVSHTYSSEKDNKCDVCSSIRVLSGTTGKCTWTLIDTLLLIEGKGYTVNYSSTSAPWGKEIAEVIICEGVTTVGNYAFYKCENLKSVTLPDSLTEIGSVVFWGCSSLTEVKIPDGVTSIGSGCFESCTSLERINIPNGVTAIPQNIFYNCISLTEINIPENVTKIAGFAFYNCRSLAKVNIEGPIDSIGDSAFYGCQVLSEVTADNGIKSISRYAFYYCKLLNNINLTSDATYIGDSAFRACGSLSSINIPDSVTYIGSDAFFGCKSLTNVNIPGGITAINSGAFRECGGLTEIIIPRTVTTIGNCAFESCESATEIKILGPVTSIGDYAFYGCSSAEKIVLPDTVTSIGQSAFYACNSLEEFVIPNGVTSIGDYTFFNSQKLKKVTLPNDITNIGAFAFYQCRSLQEINIPLSVVEIDEYAFGNCSTLVDVWYPGTLADKNKINIGANNTELHNADWHYIYSNDNFTYQISDGKATVTGCDKNLSGKITIAETIDEFPVTAIGDSAFNGCSAITEINIPSGITNIGENVFDGCTSLKRIEVAEDNENYCSLSGVLYTKNKKVLICRPAAQVLYLTVNYLYSDGEKSLDSVFQILKEGETYSIESPEILGFSASQEKVEGNILNEDLVIDVIYYENAKILSGNCNDKVSWTLYTDGTLIFRGSGNIPDYTSGNTPWSQYAQSVEIVYIDARITSLGAYAFENCSNLTYIDYGYSITRIGSYAFSGCSSLKSFRLPETVTKIEEGAFYGCTGLTGVVISDNITDIKDNAFYGCENLDLVTIGGNVTAIGKNAFVGCNVLTQIYFRGQPAVLGANALGTTENKYVYYYDNYNGWSTAIKNGLWNGYTAIPYNVIAKENFNGTNVYIIKVVDKNNIPLENAVVTLGEEVQSTNKDGMAYFIKPLINQVLTVSCSDHNSFTDTSFKASSTQVMDIIELSDRPSVVKGVSVGGDSVATSVKVVNCSTNENLEIAVNGYSKYKILKYELYQGNRLISTVKTNNKNCTFSVKANSFEEGETVFAKMYTSDGNFVASAINMDVIKLANVSESQILNELANLEFSFAFGSMGNYKIPLTFTPTEDETFYTIVKDRTIRIGINLDIGEFFEKKDDKKASMTALQKMVDDAMKTKKEPKNKIEYNVCGYIEIEYLGNGEYYVKTSYVKVGVAAKISFNAQASFYGVVGVFFKAEVSGEATLDIKISRFEPEQGFGVEDLNFSMEDKLTLEGGAYLLWGIGSASLYGTGKIGFRLGIIPNLEFEHVYISGEFGAKWSVMWGLWSGKKIIASGDIYNWSKSQTYMMRMLSKGIYEAQQDPNSYTFNDRTYLNNRSPWQSGDYLQTGIYDNVAPKIVSCGDTTVMVWLDDNSQRDASNFQMLYYSIYEDGVWSQPKAVADNGTFDCEFDLYCDGEKIYVVYTEMVNQNSNIETVDLAEDDITSMIGKVEACVAVFDGFEFNNPVCITDNDVIEVLPTINEIDGKIRITWIESSSIGIDGNITDNNICYSDFDGKRWSIPVTQTSNQNTVSDVITINLDGVSYMVYIVDADGNGETKDDQILVLCDQSGNAIELDGGLIANPQAVVVNGKNALTWYNNGKIYMVTKLGQKPIALLPENVFGSVNYQVVSLGANKTMLTFVMSNTNKEGTSDIYGVYIDEIGCLTSPVRLTDSDGAMGNYSVAFEEGELIIVFTEVFAQVSGENIETVTNLRSTQVEFFTDISVEAADFDIDVIKPSSSLNMALTLSNKGTDNVDAFTVNLYGINDELLYTSEYNEQIKSGDTKVFNVVVSLPEIIVQGNYRLEVLPKSLNTDTSVSDNSIAIVLGYADFEIVAEQKIIGEKNYIILAITNNGNISSSARIELYAPNVNGRKLSDITLEAIVPNATQQYVIELDSIMNESDKSVTVVISSQNDPFILNNTETVTLFDINNDVFLSDPEEIIHNPEISLNSTEFDKFYANDITFEIIAEAEYFAGIDGLIEGRDYIVIENSVTITKEYLSTLKNGENTLKVSFAVDDVQVISRTLTVTVVDSTPIILDGSVKIDGEAVVGGRVFAELSGVNCSQNSLTYEWKIDSTLVSVGKFYDIKVEDYGKILTLTVKGKEGVVGEISVQTEVTKLLPNVANAPIISKITPDSITVVKTQGVEYSMDLVLWQDSNVFENLTPNTEYIVYARIKATETNFAGETSSGTKVTTIKYSYPIPDSPKTANVTFESVTLVHIEGYEYSIDGINWQKESTFNNLLPNRHYTFFQRVAESDTVYVSCSSEPLIVLTPKTTVMAPQKPTVESVSYYKIVLVATEGYEYSIDGINWKSEAIFDGLEEDTQYVLYQRVAETYTSYVSEKSEALIIKTQKIPEYIVGDINGSGFVDAVDLAIMKLYLAGLMELSEVGVFAADVNNDSLINAVDLATLKLMLVGIKF